MVGNRQKTQEYLPQDEVFHQIFTNIGYLLAAVFSFMVILITDEELNTSLLESVVLLGALLVGFGFIFWIFSLISARYVDKAVTFHFIQALNILLFSSVAILVLVMLGPVLFGFAGWCISLLLGLSFVLGYYDNFSRKLRYLSGLENELIASGRLDIVNCKWNLKIPLDMNTRKAEGNRPRIFFNTTTVVIIFQLIAFIISIVLGKEFRTPMYFSFMLILFIYGSFSVVGNQAAITVRLRELEKVLGSKIYLTYEDKDQ